MIDFERYVGNQGLWELQNICIGIREIREGARCFGGGSAIPSIRKPLLRGSHLAE